MKKFTARKGGPLSSADAQAVGERLVKLTKEHGGEIKPKDVVDDARPMTSPLHKHFDWDDSTAAEKYRIVQARHLMGSIVEVTYEKGEQMERKSFFSVTNAKGTPVYVTVDTVAKNRPYAAELLAEAQSQLIQLNDLIDMLVKEYEK